MKRWLLICVLLIVVLLAGFAAYLSLTFKPEAYLPVIESSLERRLGRNVSIGSVDFSILGGVAFEIGDLSVTGDRAHPDESPLKFSRGKLKMRLFPLLSGHVSINRIVIESPSIFLRKYRDGRLSIDDMFKRLIRGGAKEEGEKERGRKDGGKGKGLELSIESVKVVNGSFSFMAELPGKRLEVVTLYPVDVSLAHLAFDSQVDAAISMKVKQPLSGGVDLSGHVRISSSQEGAGEGVYQLEGKAFDIPLSMEGTLNLAGDIPEFEGVVLSQKVDVKRLASIYSEIRKIPFPLRSSGKGKLALAAAGTPDEFGFEGEMDLTEATLFYRDQFEKYAGSDLKLLFQGRYLRPKIIISNAELRLPGMLSAVHGEFDSKKGSYGVSSSVEIKKLASLANYLKRAKRYHLSGGAVLSAKIVGGKRGERRIGLEADLKGVNVDIPGESLSLRSMNGHVELNKHKLTLDPMAGLVNGQRVIVTGHMIVGREPRGVLALRANYLDLDSIMERRKGRSPVKGSRRTEAEKGPAFPELSRDADVTANVEVDTLKYKGVKASNVKGVLRLQRGKVTWKSTSMGILNGKIRTRGNYDLKGDKKSIDFQLIGGDVSIFDYLKNFTSLGGFMDGAVSLKMRIKGDTSRLSDFRRTLMGEGLIEIKNGKIEGVDLLSDIGKVAGFSGLVKGSSEAAHRKRNVTLFEDLVAPFSIRGGDVMVKHFTFNTGDFSLNGSLRFSRDNRLDFSGDALLQGKKLGKIAGKGNFLRDSKGNILVPIMIKGPLNSPTVYLDPEGLVKGKGKELLQRLQKKLFQ